MAGGDEGDSPALARATAPAGSACAAIAAESCRKRRREWEAGEETFKGIAPETTPSTHGETMRKAPSHLDLRSLMHGICRDEQRASCSCSSSSSSSSFVLGGER